MSLRKQSTTHDIIVILASSIACGGMDKSRNDSSIKYPCPAGNGIGFPDSPGIVGNVGDTNLQPKKKGEACLFTSALRRITVCPIRSSRGDIDRLALQEVGGEVCGVRQERQVCAKVGIQDNPERVNR